MVESGKCEYYQISPGKKFQLKLTFSIFWNKFAKKDYLLSKTEKVKTTSEFCTFALV